MIKKVEIFGTTDVGQVIDHNEDTFAIFKHLSNKEWAFKRDEIIDLSENGFLLVVADGMGGTNAGEGALNVAKATVQKYFNEISTFANVIEERYKHLKKSIIKSHDALVKHQHSNLDTAGMGTTLVIAWIIEDKVHVAWSGESRVYAYQGLKTLYPFTDDHSLVWQMVQEGQMTAEQARLHPESNIITQSLGSEGSPPKPSSKTMKIFQDDKIMVCSDGLSGMLSDQEILNYLQLNQSTAEICKELVASANRAGGTDNITVLMLEVKEGKARPIIKEPAPPKPKSTPSAPPSNTQILRKKNSNKNIIIIALVALLIAAIAWLLMPKEETKNQVTIITGKSIEYIDGEALEINLAQLILDDASIEMDSISIKYNNKKLKAKKGILSFVPDTPKSPSLIVILYPKNASTTYTASIVLTKKQSQEKVEETPPNSGPARTVPAQIAPGNTEGNNENEPTETEEEPLDTGDENREKPIEEGSGTNSPTLPATGNNSNGQLTPIAKPNELKPNETGTGNEEVPKKEETEEPAEGGGNETGGEEKPNEGGGIKPL